MLKWKVKYENFNGDSKEKIIYFNLSKTEMINIIVNDEIDIEALQDYAKEKDTKEMFKFFIYLISKSYGEKSDDGEYFDKSPEIYARFRSSALYDSFVTEITTNTEKALKFFKGIFPEGLLNQAIEEVNKISEQDVETQKPIPSPSIPPLSDEERSRLIQELLGPNRAGGFAVVKDPSSAI